MIDFSNAKILDLAVHVVGNKSKDEELVLTDTSSTISNDVTEQYIKEYFFSRLVLNYLISFLMRQTLV